MTLEKFQAMAAVLQCLSQAVFFWKIKPKYLSIDWYRSPWHKNDGERSPFSQEGVSVQRVMLEKCLLHSLVVFRLLCSYPTTHLLIFPATSAVASWVHLAPPGLHKAQVNELMVISISWLAETHSLLHRSEHQHFSFYFTCKSNPKLGFHPSACDVQR